MKQYMPGRALKPFSAARLSKNSPEAIHAREGIETTLFKLNAAANIEAIHAREGIETMPICNFVHTAGEAIHAQEGIETPSR